MDKNKFAHLLVIRLSALGDVAMTVPVLKAFIHQNPDTRITVLTRPFFKPIFSAIDNVSVFEADLNGKHKGIYGLGRLYASLAKLELNAVADLHNVLRTKILKRYFALSGIPYVQIDKGRKEKKALTRANNKDFKPLKSTFERYADVFRALGYKIDLHNAHPKSRLPLPKKTVQEMGRNLSKWIGIAPFAAFEAKMYPLDLMEKVIRTLNNTDEYKMFLFGAGPAEEDKLGSLSKKYNNTINMAGTFSFSEELAFISNLDLMVSMDSGNGHLAAMYGVPTVTIWGVTHPYAGFYPFGQQLENALLADSEKFPMIPTSVYGNRFPKGYEMAIATISPDHIVEKIQAVLNV